MRKITLLAVFWFTVAGCDGGRARTPVPRPTPDYRLAITGTLAAGSSLVRANGGAVLFDGSRVANETCGFPGCRELVLAATINSDKGAHTVTLQLGRLSCDLLPCSGSSSYTVSGNVKVLDPLSSNVVQEIPLATQTLSLKSQDMVAYQIDVNP